MSTIKANTLLHSDGSTTTQPSIPALDKRMAKAWVNFNGTGTVAIRDSYNVSSITDDNTGNYRINFSTNMANTNYVAVANCGGAGGSTGDHSYVPVNTASGGTTSQSHQLRPSDHTGNRTDVTYMWYIAFSS
tara:strand:+ start:145 stop:540 length:396 start_codon:yes stop_codon:yes gene_type:complete